MRKNRTVSLGLIVPALAVLLACVSLAFGLKLREDAGRFDAIAIPDPSLAVSPATVAADALQTAGFARGGWKSFRALNGEGWDVFIDGRSGAPLLVQGEGIPFIPGSGNTMQSAGAATLESLAESLRGFIAGNAALLITDDRELALNTEGSGQTTPDLWKVVFDRVVEGVPVAGDRYVFFVGHGNLIAFGATRWSPITTDPVPSLTAADGRAVLSTYMGLTDRDITELRDRGTLTFLPMAAPGTGVDSFTGAVGTGYRTALAWRIAIKVQGEPGVWVGLVDAHSGAVLALYDETRYAQVKGAVFPISDDGACPDGCEQAGFAMPFADIKIGASSSTSGSMGSFACTPGGSTAATTLAGQYVKVVDTCGAISQTVACDADLDLKTSSGTDCAVPTGASAGDTHAARSSFYHLNRIKEHARAWLPSNNWLGQQLMDNVNINLTCNAFWDGGGATGTVNFYRSSAASGCRNTGEIAGVFLHEWGHGLDQNDGGGYDNPSEAYADITSFLLTHSSCIGRGFSTSNCTGYGNACRSCTGVRDQDWAQRNAGAPQTPSNWPASCPAGTGPCGREAHCEAYLAGETLWDLAVRDLPAAGVDQQTAWQILDRLWYKSRSGSGGDAYTCGAPASNRSCAATSWFSELRAIDDDDGNLANGTPHAAAIFAAFNRHQIPCGTSTDAANQSTSICPVLTAPTTGAAASPNAIALTWSAVPGASSYNVLRNDQGCGWGYTIVANVAATSYTDTGLPNNFPLYYTVQAVGANSACLGPLSTCRTAQAGGPHASYSGNARVADTCASGGAGNSDGLYDAGERIQFSVALKNDGITMLTGVTATVTPTTPGVSMVNATASWSNIAAGLTSTSLAPHFTAQLPTSLACGSAVNYTITINANEGSWTGSFSQTVGQPLTGGGTVLSESFAGGIPGTWTIVDGGAGGGSAATWTTANPGARTFTSPLVSPLAIVDSDNAGSSATQDEQLITPVLNLGAATAVTLTYDEYFRHFGSEIADVDVRSSLTGGAWVNVVHNQSSDTANPYRRTVDIGARAAGASNVQVRFHYYSGTYEWYWEVDNVVVTWTGPAGCNMHLCNALPSADMTVTKSGAPAAVATGQNITYTVTVTNNGPDAAAGAQLSDATPAGTTFQSVTAPTGWTCSTPAIGGTGAIGCSKASFAAGSPAVFTIAVMVNWCAGNGTIIGSTATVSSVTADPIPGNNSAAATTTVIDMGSCDDGNACTRMDTCQGGACTGMDTVVCATLDQCHDAGACDPASGQCSNPAKPNGATCNDGDACTRTDTCQGGACTGADPVACAATDQCHLAGTCNPVTGMCANPTAPDGTTCNDGNPCTGLEVCVSGTCSGLPVGPPPEAGNSLIVGKTVGEASIGWSEEAGGFNVYRGSRAAVNWIYNQTCLASVLTGPVTDAAMPAAGSAFFYLVTRVGACGESIPGRDSAGTAIPNPAPCGAP